MRKRLTSPGIDWTASMPKRSNEFQKLIYLIRVNLAAGATVSESKMLQDRITGRKREVDVCVEGIVGGTPVNVCLECRDHARPADVTWVEAMKAKHERLPTHALILASRSGFTNQAQEVARSVGIEAISFDEIDRADFHALLKGKSALWTKCVTITAQKVAVRVLPTPRLSAETVAVVPDNLVYAANGTELGPIGQFVQLVLNSPAALHQLLNEGKEEHAWFELGWEPPRDQLGNPIFLQKLEPLVLREIQSIKIGGPSEFRISEFRLRRGNLAGVEVAWGKTAIFGKDALLAARGMIPGLRRSPGTLQGIHSKQKHLALTSASKGHAGSHRSNCGGEQISGGQSVHPKLSGSAGVLFASSRSVSVRSRSSARRSLNLLRAIPAWTAREVSVLDPGSFAIVMATGITSNAMFAERQRELSDVLFRVNLFVYPWLVLATILRMTDLRAALWSDLANPSRVFSFFTFVAASDVLGVQIALRGFAEIPILLWLSALAAFAILIYFSSGLLIFRNAARGADLVVRGGGLLAIVGTHSLVLLGVPVAASTISEHGNAIFVLLHALWGIGLVLYGIFVTHFAYRISYVRVEPQDLTPLLWVVMGAAAISANAGSTLVQNGSGPDFLHRLRPFVDGASFTIWAWGTWWIPLLVMFGIWKHGVRHVPLSYTPMLWSIVFPLGMYAVATYHLSLADDYPPLRVLSHVMAWVALGAWIATTAALIVASARSLRKFTRSSLIDQRPKSQ